MSNIAEELFEQLSITEIEHLISSGKSEDQYIEAKAPQSSVLSKTQQIELGKQLSGFSNAGGGIILFGVSTTKKAHGNIDILTQIEPIGNISNLENQKRVFERWWEKKYNKPLREFDDHTEEELYIIMLEDYYDNNPVEIERFKNSVVADDDWKGETDEDYEEDIQKRLKKHHVDLSEFQSETESEGMIDLMDSLRDAIPDKNDVDDDFTFLGNK